MLSCLLIELMQRETTKAYYFSRIATPFRMSILTYQVQFQLPVDGFKQNKNVSSGPRPGLNVVLERGGAEGGIRASSSLDVFFCPPHAQNVGSLSIECC